MDTTNALSISPVPAAPSTHANKENHHTEGTGESLEGSQLAQQIERASAGAVDQHLGESKKSRGQRGPDKRPRTPRRKNPVPLETMGNGTSEPFLAEAAPVPLAGIVEVQPSFDEETAGALVDIAIGLLNDGAAAIVRAVAKNETGDVALAEEAAKAVQMSEKIDKAVRLGAVQCAKKYAVRLDYAPEMMLFGGLIIWGGQVSLSVKALKVKGAELRERDKQKPA